MMTRLIQNNQMRIELVNSLRLRELLTSNLLDKQAEKPNKFKIQFRTKNKQTKVSIIRQIKLMI